jgi:hypothetical protein
LVRLLALTARQARERPHGGSMALQLLATNHDQNQAAITAAGAVPVRCLARVLSSLQLLAVRYFAARHSTMMARRRLSVAAGTIPPVEAVFPSLTARMQEAAADVLWQPASTTRSAKTTIATLAPFHLWSKAVSLPTESTAAGGSTCNAT